MDSIIVNADIEIDEFTNEKNIRLKIENDFLLFGFAKYVAFNSSYGQVFFQLTFNYLKGKDYIVFRVYPKKLRLKKGDTISLLLENGTVVEFVISSDSYRFEFGETGYEAKEVITLEELSAFNESEVKSWKVSIDNENIDIIGNETAITWRNEKFKDTYITTKLASTYLNSVRSEIESYTPLLSRDNIATSPLSDNLHCYVYLMVDLSNDYHKIGISNEPMYREKTLQSEKPTIKLLACKKFINRKMAQSFERALHETYINKRIRGEWFELDSSEVFEVTTTLNS